ncbi:hypothetical protein IWX47DRAFT_874994 [Phyllosticta citricarpa]
MLLARAPVSSTCSTFCIPLFGMLGQAGASPQKPLPCQVAGTSNPSVPISSSHWLTRTTAPVYPELVYFEGKVLARVSSQHVHLHV